MKDKDRAELERLRKINVELHFALLAIKARINGEWDNPALVKKGPLSVSTTQDVLKYAESAIAWAKPPKP